MDALVIDRRQPLLVRLPIANRRDAAVSIAVRCAAICSMRGSGCACSGLMERPRGLVLPARLAQTVERAAPSVRATRVTANLALAASA